MLFKVETKHWIGKQHPTDAKWEFIAIGDGHDDGISSLAKANEVMRQLLRHPNVIACRAHVTVDPVLPTPPQIGDVIDGKQDA